MQKVKQQIRRAAAFLQSSFPGGAEIVLFEANMARSSALRPFLIEESLNPERNLTEKEKLEGEQHEL